MPGCFANFFHDIKTNPVSAANAVGTAFNIAGTIPLLILNSQGIIFEDMNIYAAEGIILAISLGLYVTGAVIGGAAQQIYSHCCTSPEQSESSTSAYRMV